MQGLWESLFQHLALDRAETITEFTTVLREKILVHAVSKNDKLRVFTQSALSSLVEVYEVCCVLHGCYCGVA